MRSTLNIAAVHGRFALFFSAIFALIFICLAGCGPQKTGVSEPAAPKIDLDATKAKAEAGEPEAEFALATYYANTEDKQQSYNEAAKWYRSAADKGHAGAQFALGELYEAGQGVKVDDAEAANWYRKSAEQGHARGQYALAVLYVTGKGVPKDIPEALKWYQKSASQGNAQAQYVLGMRQRDGDGLPKDKVESYKWLTLAAEQGVDDAVPARNELKREMTREEISEAQKRAAAFGKR